MNKPIDFDHFIQPISQTIVRVVAVGVSQPLQVRQSRKSGGCLPTKEKSKEQSQEPRGRFCARKCLVHVFMFTSKIGPQRLRPQSWSESCSE